MTSYNIFWNFISHEWHWALYDICWEYVDTAAGFKLLGLLTHTHTVVICRGVFTPKKHVCNVTRWVFVPLRFSGIPNRRLLWIIIIHKKTNESLGLMNIKWSCTVVKCIPFNNNSWNHQKSLSNNNVNVTTW